MDEDRARSLSVCIQALQAAIRYNELLERSETTEAIDYQESSLVYERELIHLIEKYKQVEEGGRARIPLRSLLRPPFDVMAE